MAPPFDASIAHAAAARAVFFVSDSTGITAETLGSALLANFPGAHFTRHTIPFVSSATAVDAVVAALQRAAADGHAPIVFATLKDAGVRTRLAAAGAVVIDLLAGHLTELEAELGATAETRAGQYHGLGDLEQYFRRMRAVEFAIEHDDGQSGRDLASAEVIIVAPSRCGKTPTTMYLALHYGLLVANYPLTDDDFPTDGLPRIVAPHADRCFGLTTTALRLSQVRHERRPHSTYASLAQCTLEIRRAEDLYRRTHIPFLSSATRSVEEMSAVILQSMNLRDRPHERPLT
ncbi:MAG: phosphoenolpyruvate synthase regulatory protein [Microbacterium sp. 71-36]|uniref:pyruvate, water dikinase regulatory protein n=1 Tax=unclassified Microbacterium TaxID=2609290 RepID=UPI00086DA40C|nr:MULTISPECIES: pyruvate, phosphate dikinase/phosphoenolpyruvate synthase regulator [unclassified Microbacterium]MBN9212895.1 pyruvate, phosphate dikinase/phosphoenolpyruvate synthase regulator [Microbacterium sp.]ODT41372.1 MAG: phosphoenolpyruvate synthase regulatory protein [Microbacterium sp. SCN 71-17]OJV75217.1 MAG: phosphoenolpyruvate synthase regulatory protein [Microbacterium sp. 71-36]